MTGGVRITGQTGIASGLDRTRSRESLEKAGQQFEAVFTGMMLKSMRKTKLAEGLFDTKASEQFRDMADQKLVESMAATTPLGIGRAMTAFLSKGAATPVAGAAAAEPQGSGKESPLPVVPVGNGTSSG